MPITKYSPNKLKKTKKDDLIIHILDLYSFIEIFDNKSIKHITKAKLQEENEKLKEDNEKLREKMGEPASDFGQRVWSILYDKDYCPTSYGEAGRFIEDIIEENEKIKIEIEEHGSIIEKLDHRIADVRAENKKLEGLKSHAIDIAAARGIQIDKLEKELYRYKDVPQLGRNYQIASKENKKLKEEIEKLKKHYEWDLMEWKGKHKSLEDQLDLYRS